MRPFFISYDLPVGPAEDVFKEAARRFNAAFTSVQEGRAVAETAEVFLVLREIRRPSTKGVQVKYDSKKNFLGIDCPLQVHTLENEASSVVESLAITMSKALSVAQDYCAVRCVPVDFGNIVGIIEQVVRAERGKTDA